MIGLAGVVLSCTFMSHQHYHQVHIQVIQYMVAYWKRKQLDYCDHSMTERIFMPLMTNVNVKLLWTKKCLFANTTERGFLSQKVDHEYHFFHTLISYFACFYASADTLVSSASNLHRTKAYIIPQT
mmetsp:Transcript_636/g.789  ORF Transcript_636/g.789 Transcript_636/m.789 type:complete len:126 (-) Transcript_636:308-685(-)